MHKLMFQWMCLPIFVRIEARILQVA